jgi:hypothetical protein
MFCRKLDAFLKKKLLGATVQIVFRVICDVDTYTGPGPDNEEPAQRSVPC